MSHQNISFVLTVLVDGAKLQTSLTFADLESVFRDCNLVLAFAGHSQVLNFESTVLRIFAPLCAFKCKRDSLTFRDRNFLVEMMPKAFVPPREYALLFFYNKKHTKQKMVGLTGRGVVLLG